MNFPEVFKTAFVLILELDSNLAEIILLSLRISFSAIAIASLIALPLGALLAVKCFPTRGFWISLLNAFMGLPPVVVGLFVYLMLSRSGPLGPLSLLYTPTAMIVAQVLLIFPIIAALAHQTIRDLWGIYEEQLRSLGSNTLRSAKTLLWEGRYSLLTAVLAGFGRGSAEVGAVLIVGGNINHSTRVMTTTIAMESSKGNLSLALALGVILILLSVTITSSIYWINRASRGSAA